MTIKRITILLLSLVLLAIGLNFASNFKLTQASLPPKLDFAENPNATPIVNLDMPKISFANRFTFRKTDIIEYLKPGVIHLRREQSNPGPLKINVLLFDLTAPELNIKVALQNDWLSGVARTSALAKSNDAVAAVNGDLFSSNGLPQGMTMSDGKLALAPKRRATFAYSKQRGPFIGLFTQNFTWPSSVVAANGERHSLEVLNTICKDDWLCVYNDMSHELAAGNNDVRVVLDEIGQVTNIRQETAITIPTGKQVLLGKGQAAKWLLENVHIGEKVDLNMVTDPDYANYEQIISGGPVILRQSQFVQDCLCYLEDCSDSKQKEVVCEEFTTSWKLTHYLTVRMPRNGVGYNADRSVLIVAVADGYQPGYSIGMTQKEFSELFLEFGAESAMELDGGGSATMYANGKLANHPSDGNGNIERWVPDALVFQWNDTNSGFNFNNLETATPESTNTPKPTVEYKTPTPVNTKGYQAPTQAPYTIRPVQTPVPTRKSR